MTTLQGLNAVYEKARENREEGETSEEEISELLSKLNSRLSLIHQDAEYLPEGVRGKDLEALRSVLSELTLMKMAVVSARDATQRLITVVKE